MGTVYIIIASVIWGILHSVLASHRFKRIVRKLFGTQAFYRMYRFSYNLFSVASFFPLLLMLLTFPDKPLYNIQSPWIYAMIIGQGLAVFVLVAGVMQTGLLEFAGLGQLLDTYEDSKPTVLVVDGLYAYVRHPLYTAGLVFIWLSPEMTINRLALWLVFSLYIIVGAYFEERKLAVDFGPAYVDYKAKTPMFLPQWYKKS